jgi:hypothetical protein
MPFTTSDLLLGFVLPALLAALLYVLISSLISRLLGKRLSLQPAATVALVAGFQLGYWLLSLGPPVPKTHWHWLPWVTLLPVAAALLPTGSRPARIGQAATVVVITLISAWLLVPDWDHLQPSRTIHMAIWSTALILLTASTAPLTTRITDISLPLVLTMVMSTAAVVLLLSESLRFCQVLLAATGPLAGMTLAAKWRRPSPQFHGIAFSFQLLLCGELLIGYVNSFSDVPLLCYALIPIAPLGLWPSLHGPLSRLQGWKAILGRLSLPATICLLTIIIALVTSLNSESY